jgi:hypothetical protein
MVNKGFYDTDYMLLEYQQTAVGGMLDDLSLFFGDGSMAGESGGFESV